MGGSFWLMPRPSGCWVPPQELEGQLVELLVPEARPLDARRHRAGYVADPLPRPMDVGMLLAGRRRDGSTFPAEISLSAIDSDRGTSSWPRSAT